MSEQHVLNRLSHAAFYFLSRRLPEIRQFKTALQQNCLDSFINQQLVSTLLSARDSTSFYRNQFSGIDIENMDLAKFYTVPESNKELLRSAPLDTWPKKRSTRKRETSGSTGNPFVFLQDFSLRNKIIRRYVSLENDLLCLGRSIQRIVNTTSLESPEYIKKAVRLYPEVLNVPNLNPLDHLDKIVSLNPDMIMGRSSILYAIVMELVSRNQLPPALGALRFTQETMFDFQIRNIENQTGLPVFGSYGSEELSGVLAHSCRHGVYHVHPLIGHVEIVNDDGLPVDPGDEGRILATSFINRCMPFIRYDTGDIATSLGTDYVCPCGCPYPVFGSLQVSRKYLIPKRSGGEYSDALIAQHLIRDTGDTAPFIEGFYLQQDGEWQWDMMLLLRNNADSEDIISRMQERANRLFKNEVDITVRICHELPRTRTGKRRTVIFQDEH